MVGVNKCRKCGQNFPVTPDGIEQYNAHIKICGQADADKKLPVIDYGVEGVEEIVNDEKKLVLNTMGLYGDVKMPDYDTKGLTKNQLIVRNIYKAVLSRLPLNSELRDSEWVKALDDGSMNENQVKNKIMICNEKKIIDIYQKYLLRGPGLEERQQWMKKIEAVKPENCPELILWIERCIKNSNEALKKMQ